jgi:hypothetical protein
MPVSCFPRHQSRPPPRSRVVKISIVGVSTPFNGNIEPTIYEIAQAQRDSAPAFSPHRSAVLGIYVVVVAGLARRTESHSTGNRPAPPPSRYRFDLEISRGRWRGRRPQNCPRDSSTDPRDSSREFSVGRTTHPRFAGETRRHRLTGHSIVIYAAVAEIPSLTGVADFHKAPRDQPLSKTQRASLGS